MTVMPLYDAERLLAGAVRDALLQATDRVYYQVPAIGATKPLLVYQLQSDISPSWYLDGVGASALVTVKAVAANAQDALLLLSVAAPLMDILAADDVTIRARYVRTPAIPPTPDGVYQSAHIWRVQIERN
jgi:hypothetical protein